MKNLKKLKTLEMMLSMNQNQLNIAIMNNRKTNHIFVQIRNIKKQIQKLKGE